MNEPCHALPKNFLRACVMLLLHERPVHGYDLVERLRALGFDQEDHGRLYRALHRLETDGLVTSEWEASHSGPSRCVYALTDAGAMALSVEAARLEDANAIVEEFLCRCANGHRSFAPSAAHG